MVDALRVVSGAWFSSKTLCTPCPLPLDSTASLHTSSRSPKVCRSGLCRPEVPTHLGVSSTPQPHNRTCQGHRPPHIGIVGGKNTRKKNGECDGLHGGFPAPLSATLTLNSPSGCPAAFACSLGCRAYHPASACPALPQSRHRLPGAPRHLLVPGYPPPN